MSEALSKQEVKSLKSQIEARRREVVEDIHQELVQSDQEHYVDLAGRVHDTGDESVADLLSDVELAVVDRHLEELRDLEAAQLRLAMGSYGTCADCGGHIGYRRLSAYPTAKRCMACQERYEQSHASRRGPSL